MRSRTVRKSSRRRATAWAEGLSFVGVEAAMFPINNGPTGLTYANIVQLTNATLLAEHGGEGMVVARIIGDFTPHFMSSQVDGQPLDRQYVLRVGLARVRVFDSATVRIPDFFSATDLGSEDIMFLREFFVLELRNDFAPGGVAIPDFRRVQVDNQTPPVLQTPRNSDYPRNFDVTAKRRVTPDDHVFLLLEAREMGAFGAPDPDFLNIEFTAWLRMLVLRPVR